MSHCGELITEQLVMHMQAMASLSPMRMPTLLDEDQRFSTIAACKGVTCAARVAV